MSEDNKFGLFLNLIIAILFIAAASIVSVFPVTIPTNTMADEAKIVEMTNFRADGDKRFLLTCRSNIIEEMYSLKEYPGFGKTSAKVLLILAGIPAFIALFILAYAILSGLNIGTYFAAKAKGETERTKHYKKTLDELIRIQEKISK